MNLRKASGRNGRAAAVALAMAGVMLSACSGGLDSIFGNSNYDDTVLPGDRISVAQVGAQIAPDPEALNIPVVVPAAITNYDWAQPGGVPSNAPQHLSLGLQLKRVWRAGTGAGSSTQGRLTASPIIAGGRVFALDTEARVFALNAQNGDNIWSVNLAPKDEEEEEGYGGGIASDGAKVYVTTGFGTVAALDPATGQLVWKERLSVPVRAAPTVADGKVFVTTINNEVFAISTTDGSQVWKFAGVAEGAGVLVSTSPAVSEDVVVMPYSSGDVIAFGVNDGRAMWNENLTRTGQVSSLAAISNVGGRPVINRGVVYAVAHAGRLIALDIKTGKRLWSQDISSVQTPWVAGDYVFILSDDGNLFAISAQEGKIRWIRKLPEKETWSGPVLAGGRLVIVNSEGAVWSVAPQSGEIVNQFSLGEKVYIPPVVANGTIYFYTEDAELIAMR